MKNKIGIVTFFDELNYGAALQAYALQKYISKRNNNVYFLDKSLSDYVKIKTNIMQKIKKIILFSRIKKKGKSFEKFRKNEFKINDSNYKYDLVIFGSDQIWNTDITQSLFQFYLGNTIDSKKISYAASCGKEIKEKDINIFKENLNSFDAISVREKTTAIELTSLLGREVVNVVDPCILLEKDEWIKLSLKSSISLPNEKYIFVYCLEDNEKLNEIVENISKEFNLKVVTLRNGKHFKNEICRYPYANPYDFLNILINADFVVSNSFHATVFSWIFQKKFIPVLHKNYGLRIVDFIKLTNSEHLLNENIDYKKSLFWGSEKEIIDLINISKDFLNSHLC